VLFRVLALNAINHAQRERNNTLTKLNEKTTMQLQRNTDSTHATSPFLQLAQARAARRPLHISLPVRRREGCLTRRALLAALREAEFDEWQASGGDFLDHSYQPAA
jgi:hypothetical protein